eukprot:141848-Amphidinium_carterae.1
MHLVQLLGCRCPSSVHVQGTSKTGTTTHTKPRLSLTREGLGAGVWSMQSTARTCGCLKTGSKTIRSLWHLLRVTG